MALTEGLEQLPRSPHFLELVLKALRTIDNQAFPLKDLTKKIITFLQPVFIEAVNHQLDTGSLSPGVGWVVIKKNRLLVLVEDVHGYRHAPATPAATPVPVSKAPVDFAALYDEAFNRLDRQRGAHNFVSLVELRQAIPVDRTTFDAELRKLRLAGQYTLSAAEGRHGISIEEREAGISEGGALLLFVSRK
jgi:hypothetical protein